MSRAAIEIEDFLPATLTAPGLSPAEFLELCAKFPDAMVEYTADGRVIVTPPTDPESGERVGEVFGQLRDWARSQKHEHVCGPDSGEDVAAEGLRVGLVEPSGASRRRQNERD